MTARARGRHHMGHIRKLRYGFEDLGPDEQAEADRQTASLAGLAVTLLLVVFGLFLVKELHAKSVLEDCLLSGQTRCLVELSPR
jgi:hypothetical protein